MEVEPPRSGYRCTWSLPEGSQKWTPKETPYPLYLTQAHSTNIAVLIKVEQSLKQGIIQPLKLPSKVIIGLCNRKAHLLVSRWVEIQKNTWK